MNIKMRFLGAAQNVTGSCFMVEVDGFRFVVDCGMFQERAFRNRNWDSFPVPPESIDAILLTHAHVDHCGLLPKLINKGFNGPVYCTDATAEITKIILMDSAKIQEQDAENKARRHQREGRKGPYPEKPLYTIEDAEATFPLFSSTEYEKTVEIGKGIEATFYDAGHVLGSSMIKVRIQKNGEERTILFSGDIGRRNKPILQDPTRFKEADYILVESTYGNRLLDKPGDMTGALASAINYTVKAGGNIVIPSFALERAQELLYYLNECLMEDSIPHLMVFIDSPMAINITEVFDHHPKLFDEEMVELIRERKSPFDLPGLTLIRSVEESKAINHLKGSAIIIAGSGMCTGGRIKYHLINNIDRPESTILFVGYQAIGTLGRQIVDGAKKVRILGRHYPVKANIVQLNGFSAHADRDQLLGWLSGIEKPPRQVFVVHGEEDSAQEFAKTLVNKTGWNVSVPQYKDEVVLN